MGKWVYAVTFRTAIALAFQSVLVLLSGIIVFPVFVGALDNSVIGYHLSCRRHVEDRLPSPSGRYEVVMMAYSCPTHFYPSLTKVIRVRVSQSRLPIALSGADVYWYNGYKYQSKLDEVVSWESDFELHIKTPGLAKNRLKDKNYPERWRDVAISHQP